MELTQVQRDFFADLDLASATKAGEEKVQFDFLHKGRIVEVAVYSGCEADIRVKHRPEGGRVTCIDPALSLPNIPGTVNMSGPAVLRRVHAEANKPGDPQLKRAWLDTPYVELWPVDVMGARVKFSWQDAPVCYELWASKAQDIPDITTVDLLVDWERAHTFLLPLRCPKKPTAEFVFELAEAITEAWRDAVAEESK